MFGFSPFRGKQTAPPPPPPRASPQPTTSAPHVAAPPSPVYVRAAALTYVTAPYPSDSTEGIFEALLLLAAGKVNANGSSTESRADAGGWLARAWRHVTDYSAAHLLKARQEDFLAAFSRQLELNPAEESNVVMVSCHCFIVSNGELVFGTLYATNCGLYFCAAAVPAAANAGAERAETGLASSDAEPAAEGMEFIKERVLFTDMASFLPSIFLEQKDRAPPFVQGVPSAVVAPTALQVFTVRRSTVIQFVGLHEVVVKPPRKAAAERERAGVDAAQDAPCTDVVRKTEHLLITELPPSLDTLKVCALLWRLWAERLNELGLPLEHPAARYAEPH
ncbi:hypothetical protein ABB37_08612 [Leptomonas pyrrhocoris]|uniref:GRAM domain-containing protein n=1 Tax=Leptomonas pyrrhocoris TaxID=157538 RepID=A0A0M9FSS7_LEPPY|nr:hypothetical protein ABB37_08612 [Leptomonas pyrrhocoris]KPA75315.1 hypothetical protein ABB37_08612 [Leptomonas pyrrhocoris]|eukprot:XP_015653754.1 hypothetical protein ABB37_08612 [Leptomonas pyrrhocoris]